MTANALIRAISNSHHPELLKAQCIGLIREIVTQPDLSLDQLLQFCAKAVGTTVRNAKSQSRLNNNVRARLLFVFYIFKHKFNMLSLTEIGAQLGNRDHTTIIHNRERAYDLEQAKDELFLQDLNNLYILIGGGTIDPPKKVPPPPTRRGHNGTPVYNFKTGQRYDTMRQAAVENNINIQTFRKRIRKNIIKDFPFKKI